MRIFSAFLLIRIQAGLNVGATGILRNIFKGKDEMAPWKIQ